MKLRKLFAVLVACAMLASFATISASANGLAVSGKGWSISTLNQVAVGIDLFGVEEAGDGDLKLQFAEGVKYSDVKSVKFTFNGVEGDTGFAAVVQSESLGWWDQLDASPDEIVDNVFTRSVNASDSDGYLKFILVSWSGLEISNPVQATLLDAAGNVIPVYAFGEAPAAGGAGNTSGGSDEDDKQEAPTGLGNVAVASAVALVAAGVVVFARRRK